MADFYGRPLACKIVAFTVAAGTAVTLPPGEFIMLSATAACWVQFGASGVTPVAKTAPAFLVQAGDSVLFRRPSSTPGATKEGTPVPTHLNAIRDAADGTLSVVGLTG